MVSNAIYVVIPAGIIVVVVGYLIVRKIVRNFGFRKHRKIASDRLKQRDMEFQSIKDFDLREYLSEEDAKRILQLSTSELLQEIRARKVTSEAVMRLYIKLAIQSHKNTNCISHCLFAEAIERAVELDAHIERTGEPIGAHLILTFLIILGPLHGLPISIKECIDVKGTDSTLGFTSKCFQNSASDSSCVQLLRSSGAIPFVKTNVPQTLLLSETCNYIFGTTTNPYNSLRTCGGSSGGEAALLASGGSPVGLGTDIGGSIRIPANFCGIYGLKTTSGRVSMIGCNTGVRGQEAIRGTAGPMGRTVEDLTNLMRILVKTHELDERVPPMDFQEEVYNSKKKLRIGYYTSDGFLEASNAYGRAVNLAVEKLRELGHEVVEFDLEDTEGMFSRLVGLLTADGAKTLLGVIGGGEIVPTLKTTLMGSTMPKLLRHFAGFVMGLLGWNRIRSVLLLGGNKSVDKVWALQFWKNIYTERFLSKMRKEGIDAIIAPGFAVPAFQLGASKDLSAATSYTILYNLLNFPAGTVPVTVVNGDDLSFTRNVKKDMWEKNASLVDKDSKGLPIGVQVISYPWRDELVLRVMKELEEKIQFPTWKIPLDNIKSVYQ